MAKPVLITESYPTPTPPTTGKTLISMIRDLIRAHARADEDRGLNRDARMNAAWVGAYSASRTTAFVPIESCIEALAQIIFLQDELEEVLSNLIDSDECQSRELQSAIQALKARPVLIAKWLEREFDMDRKEWALEFFGSDELGRRNHLPHLQVANG